MRGIRDAHDRDAERALVGAAMYDPTVVARVDLSPDAFFVPALAEAWRDICTLTAAGKPVDEIMIADRSGADLEIIAQCLASTPTADNAEHWADIVRRHAVTRSVLLAASSVLDMHAHGRAEGLELLSAAMDALAGLETGEREDATRIGDVLRQRLRELDKVAEARSSGRVEVTGIPTGVQALDAEIGGYQRGIITIACGRPGMGKSALALSSADAASAAGHGVHVFSFEDSRAAYADRLLARVTSLPTEAIRTVTFPRGQFATAMVRVAAASKRDNWLYHDTTGLDADAVVRAVRRCGKKNKTELVIVDYLQLLKRPHRYESKHDAIEQSMDVLATAAKKDGMAYLVLAQLNRDVEKRPDKRPQLSDLRDSGSIEERSKCVLGLYRGSYYGEPKQDIDYDRCERRPTDEEWKQRADILVLKNNHGRTGYIQARFDGPTTRIW